MASNPPFMVEDTDEDFFDKLVNDDDDYKPCTLSINEKSSSSIVNDNDAKAFANLSITDAGTGLDDLGKLGVDEEEKDNIIVSSAVNSEQPNSFSFDSVNEEHDNGSGATSGIKEVQWSAFDSDSLDFFDEFGDDRIGKHDNFITSESYNVVNNSLNVENVNNYSQQFQGDQAYYATTGKQENVNDYSKQLQTDRADTITWELETDAQDPNTMENLYPGWRYDTNTAQWYQVDESNNATSYAQQEYSANFTSDWTASNDKSEVSYLQQSAQTVVGSVTLKDTTASITNLNQVSQDNNYIYNNNNNNNNNNNKVYPSHMVFDPQYPDWYYDMNIQEWRSLDDYNSQSSVVVQDQVNQNGFVANYGNDQKTYGVQEQDNNWNGSFSNAEQQISTMWQPNNVANSAPMSEFRNSQQVANHFGTSFHVDNHVNQQQSYDFGSVNKATKVNKEFPSVSGSQSFVHFSQPFCQPSEHSEMTNILKAYGNQNQFSYMKQPDQSGHQIPYGSTAGRSSDGRPPHALVTFGFGGKLIVMKDSTSLVNASYGGQDSNTGSISVLNLAEVVIGGARVHDYFHTLCQQPFPWPLSGGNAGGKELNRWIDERITHSETSDADYNKVEVLRLLLSLLKIASQHYGKLRSPFGSDTTLKENDAPEVAVARLFSSVKSSAENNNYGAFANCLQQVPSEGQTRETAAEVQTLLVSGRKKDALRRAQEGQLWGPALVLAAQLGDQFYVDTVKKMALGQLVPGSPLRTLCLLIAGQPADVFASDTTTDGGIPGAVNMSHQPTQAQLSVNSMLDDWEDNLAVITANRTKDDELVLIHLGDCLWKERSNIIAAHICYLVAEANFEPYSDSARLCLIGADHWKHPRTYASPEAIQRTEVYEYSKMLGNSQFMLLSFQPYKLIYAHMLAEVGRVSDSLKYCQALTKSLKTGRIPEVETWRQLVISLEDRIKAHQLGGFSTNLAPGKIYGKLLNLLDSTAHRVVGGLPPPVPSASGGSTAQNDHHHQSPNAARVFTSQSTMAISSLMASASMEPINQVDVNNTRMIHNRSASEPDFGRSPRQNQDDTLKENSADSQSKASGKTSRLGLFGFGSGLFQKTVGMVLKPRQDKQAKLGDTNKFYYDEKLKRWVEEGADPPAEEAALPPPPTMAAFQNGSPDYSLKTALRSESMSCGSSEFVSPTPASYTSGIPQIPAATNQFSARGRTGVRARYVDTFNQGGCNPTNLFQSPSVPTKASPNPQFFVPTAAPEQQPVNNSPTSTPDNLQQNTTISSGNQTPSFLSSSSIGMQKFASMDDIGGTSSTSTSTSTSTSSFTNHPMSRRTLSWSGNANQVFSLSGNNGQKPLGSMAPYMFMPNESGLTHPSNDDLQEVEL